MAHYVVLVDSLPVQSIPLDALPRPSERAALDAYAAHLGYSSFKDALDTVPEADPVLYRAVKVRDNETVVDARTREADKQCTCPHCKSEATVEQVDTDRADLYQIACWTCGLRGPTDNHPRLARLWWDEISIGTSPNASHS